MCDHNHNNRHFLLGIFTGSLLISFSVGALVLPPAPISSEATITSDQMELVDHGAKTIFDGNVLLQKELYELKADRMTRERESGLIHVKGRIVGTWKSPDRGNVQIRGDQGVYNPTTEKAELWTGPSKKVMVDWNDKQGKARFYSERAEFDATARKVRLINRVTGHIVPASK